MAQRISSLPKKTFGNLFFTLYFEKIQNKQVKLTSEVNLNLSYKDLLWIKQKTTSPPDSDIYTQY